MAKIAFIDVTATVSYGGIQTAVWSLAQAISVQGHEVTVIGGKVDEQRHFPDGVRRLYFAYTPRDRFPNFGSRFRKLAERLSFAYRARTAVRAEQFDWIILTKPLDFFWTRLLGKRNTTRFAFMSGGRDFIALDRWFIHRIQAWFSCSHFNAWQIHARYKRFATVIFNGVDTALFRPTDDRSDLRLKLRFSEEDVVFAYAGRMVGWKGLAHAIEALAQPSLADVPAKLLLVADGPILDQLQSRAQDLGVFERIVFHEAVPHQSLPSYYAAADVGVFPSIGDEAFGITIAEAMSCGKPVIASYIGGIPEVVGNEESCGLLVAPGNATALAEAMRKLAESPELRQQMGATGRERVERLFTWNASAKRLLKTLGLPCG
jgi:glycosyltransferase involved in cell wall biosynthesis